jgi:hypothetical protein
MVHVRIRRAWPDIGGSGANGKAKACDQKRDGADA